MSSLSAAVVAVGLVDDAELMFVGDSDVTTL
jgi:hypothetical protein